MKAAMTAAASAFLGLGLFVSFTPAEAVDITTCEDTVPAATTGVLQADLVGCKTGVFVEDGATLQLHGHVVGSSTAVGVQCEGRSCTVSGPGEISGGLQGITNVYPGIAKVLVENLSVHDCSGAAIWTLADRLTLNNVSITHNGSGDPDQAGAIAANWVRGTQVTLSDNVGYGLLGPAQSIVFRNLTATGNGDPVTFAYHARLIDSTLTGNDASGAGVDVYTLRRPRLHNTTCGRSGGRESSETIPWGACSNDS